MAGTITVRYVRSAIGHKEDQKRTIRALGLRKLNHTVTLPDNPSVRGMVFKVSHLVRVEETEADE